MRATRTAALAVALAFAVVPAAQAAPPPNDDISDARALGLPDSVQGTTQDATLAPEESGRINGVRVSNSVWYRISSSEDDTLVLDLSANGDLDAGVEVYRRARSQLNLQQSALTGEDGKARIVERIDAGRTYLVRVVQRANSVPGTFTLRASVPKGPPPGPGAPLGGRSAKGRVDPLGETADAWSKLLVPGVTYRINLSAKSRAVAGLLYPPGTRDFEDSPAVKGFGSYTLYTPGPDEGGRYSFLVSARGLGDPQRYRLSVAPTGFDDLWPGRALHNYQRLRASLNAKRIDVVDTYHFDVGNRSAVAVHVRPEGDDPLRVTLRRGSGKLLGRSFGAGGEAVIERVLWRGSYDVTVQALPGFRGRYTLWRVARALTSLRLSTARRVPLGAAVSLNLQLSPAISGRARVVVERFDPASGWHFNRVVRPAIAFGRATVTFVPATQGRWRARAAFLGTRAAQPSETRKDTYFSVRAPLDPR